jgi:hypothetical protein
MLMICSTNVRETAMSPEDPQPRPDDGVADAWTVSLDPASPAPGDAGDVIFRTGSAGRRRRAGLAVLAGMAVLFGLVWLPWPSGGSRDAAPAVVGRGLAVPVSLRLPAGAVTLADRGYVGLRLYDGPGGVLVTVPAHVVRPSGVRAELPDDPAQWLMGDPRVFVSRVRTVTVAGRSATQVDYRLSRETPEGAPLAAVSLFCGRRSDAWPGTLGAMAGPAPCTRVSPAARMRATFVPVAGRVVLIEAAWPADATASGRMPPDLRASYRALLAGVTAEA